MKKLPLVAAILFLFVAISGLSLGGTSNSLMDISASGSQLVCTNRDSGTLSIVDLEKGELVQEIKVGRHPEGVTYIGDTNLVVVAVYADDLLTVVDTASGKVVRTIDVTDEPYGVIDAGDGKHVYATLEFPGQLIRVDVTTGKVTDTWDVGQFPRGLAKSSTGQIYISEYLTGALKQFDIASGQLTNVDAGTGDVFPGWQGTAEDSLARQVTLHPVSNKAYLAHQRSRVTVAHGSGSIFPYVSAVNTKPGNDPEAKRRRRVQMDSFRGTYVVANPWETAISPDGQSLYVIFGGTDDMFVCNVLDDDYRELEYKGGLRVGSNPRAVRVSPDGATFYVYNALDFNVVGYNAKSLQQVMDVKVTNWPYSDEVLLGKKLFYTANPPMTSRRWISCSSCHPDSDADGRTWQQPEGLRNTQPMLGLKHTHPIHWSADRDEVQDFEITIRSALMQGRGLINGPVNDGLADPNGGRSEALDALAAYTNSHGFTQSPFAKQGLSESAERGKALFFSKETQCATCHSGAYFTDQKMHDVGTAATDPTEKLGPEFDTPTVLAVYRSGPYLHHGQAKTLREVLVEFNQEDIHGKTTHLTDQQLNDLVEYLKALPIADMPSEVEESGHLSRR
ncbi:MAG: c-type cytochrome [Planctomycetaceae bacterium]|nr:c-type cytochrome [Planctomycetaceae bacterium]